MSNHMKRSPMGVSFNRFVYWFLVSFCTVFLGTPLTSFSKERSSHSDSAQGEERDAQGRRVVYKQKNVVDFDALLLEGDIKNPNEFYFVHRPEEKFGSLVKKRKNFHKEMLRDSVMVR